MQISSSVRLLLAVAAAAGVAAALAAGAPARTAGERDSASWCALMIEINTAAGYMKHEHYGKLTQQIFKAVIDRGRGYAAQPVSAAPASITSTPPRPRSAKRRVPAGQARQATFPGRL